MLDIRRLAAPETRDRGVCRTNLEHGLLGSHHRGALCSVRQGCRRASGLNYNQRFSD